MTADGAGPAADRFAPYATRMLPVGDGHELYVEEVGNRSGAAVVFLHGGPGSGCQPSHRLLFDPERHRAVLFDQRGAGRSTPLRSRHANTTAYLVADMEAIRIALGIERWLIVGGSWGATLGLAYAERHPRRVSGMVLRATFLGTRDELDRAFSTTLGTVHPALHGDFLAVLPPEERADPLPNYWRRILNSDPAIHRPAARAWHDTERVLSVLRPPVRRLDPASLADPSGPLPSTPFMEAHYFAQDCFLEPDALRRNAKALADIPGVIVQGQYDLLCPPATSHALAAVWPAARIEMIEAAGHALSEPGIEDAVRRAIASLG